MVQFNFIYDPNVSLEQRVGFEMAAAIYSQFLTDDVTVNLRIVATDGLANEQAIGGAVPLFHEQNYGVYQEYVDQDVTSAEDAQASASLQEGNTVDVLIDGEVVDGNSNILLTSAQAKALGMSDSLQLENGSVWDRDLIDPNALDGYIVVNNSFDWSYDFAREFDAPEGTLDFLTMALHEIGHQLGFVSGLDGLLDVFELHSGEERATGFTALDMFRHSIDSQAIENPDGDVLDLTLGANAYFSLDGDNVLGTFSTGEDFQAGHWERFQQAIGIMDPTLAYQERLSLSHLDLQAFDALGWDVNYGALEQGLDFQALYQEALQDVANDFGIGVAAVESALDTGKDWYSLGYGSWWQAFEDQMLELGYGEWWQQFEADMLDLGYGTWWQAFDQQLMELGYGSWWQIFESQVLELGYGSWWQEFEGQVMDLGYGTWWQKFEPQMLELSYGSWWQIFEQQMLTLGYGNWWQEFEANLMDLGYGSWWQAFESQVLELGYGSWWQVFETTVLDLGYGSWWQEFESNLLELGYGEWWQVFELGYGSWWQQVEQHSDQIERLGEDQTVITDGDNQTVVSGGSNDDILAGNAGNDLISGDGGDDLIDGKGGDDLLLGDEGNDILYGSDGHDEMYGGTGDDALLGEDGNDQLFGEDGHDILSGGRGNDLLDGGEGRDVLKGDVGSDVLDGGAGDDNLSAGSDNDIAIGGDGQDTVSGGSGDDQLYGDAYRANLVHYAAGATEEPTVTEEPAGTTTDGDSATSTEDLLSDLTGSPTDSQLLDFWMRLEAEDLKLKHYNTDNQDGASGGEVISTSSDKKSEADTKFEGPSGTYQIIVGYYDDNANTSDLTLKVDKTEYNWLLDQGTGNNATSDNFFTYTIDNVDLEAGDKLELIGNAVGNEQVRIDYIDIVAVDPDAQAASGNLDAAFYNGNFYAVAANSSTAIEEASDRGGSLVTPEAGSQFATWLQNTFGTTANIIEIQGETESFNLIGSDQASQTDVQRIEAESLNFKDGKEFETVDEDEYGISASGNTLLVAASDKKKYQADITIETTGIYNIYAQYFDHSDGVAEATVLINGEALHSWQFNLDDDSLHSRVLGQNVLLNAGDKLQLEAQADHDDEAAIDYFLLEEANVEESLLDDTVSEAGTRLRFEIEDMDLSAGKSPKYRSENAASGGSVVYTSDKKEGLIATTNFSGATGLYNIVVGYFDDNGGDADYSVNLGDTLLDSWQANLELEDSNTGSNNFVTRTVATGQFIHTGDSLTLQSIREGNDYAYVDYVEFIAYDPTAPIRIEAEYMSLTGSADLYTSNISNVASTGRAIRSNSSNANNTVEGTTTFTGVTGIYDIVIAYFDENDGKAKLSISQGDTLLDSWVADQNFGSSGINATTYTTRTISGVSLETGDDISFSSLRNNNDWGAVDYIEFRPFDEDASLEIQLEAEMMDLSGDASIDFGTFAAGNRFAQVAFDYGNDGNDDDDDDDDDDDNWRPREDGQYKATSLFSGESGYYDVVVGYFDENDGAAELSVNIANREVDRWYADQNLGTNGINSASFTTRTVARGLYLETTDLIELAAIQDAGDQGAFDYIQFIAVDEPVASVTIDLEQADGNADILRGGLGDDLIDGGLGDDILFGEDELNNTEGGNDTLYGGEGNDTLYGNAGNDFLFGDYTTGLEVSDGGNNANIPNSFTYNGSTYVLTDGFMGWAEAQEQAESLGGNLVTINDAAEETWLKKTFGTNEWFWLGLTDQDSEGNFEWVSGETVTYTNWLAGEPNNAGGSGAADYVRMNVGGNLQWADYGGDSQLYGIIEIDNSSPAQVDSSSPAAEESLPEVSGNDELIGGSGNDTLSGGGGNDTLNGTDENAAGLLEIDTLIGGAGADKFILGDTTQAYYSTQGDQDYAIIRDFNINEDTVQLHGIASNYQQQQSGNNLQLFYNNDLVAVFENTSAFSLSDNAFVFV